VAGEEGKKKTAREEAKERLAEVTEASKQRALMDMAWFPGFMLVCYLILIGYFVSRGGYKPVDLTAHHDPGHAAAEEF
jgi:hypothetical protein